MNAPPHQPYSAPEIVVFDLGKVLVDFDYGIAARKIAAHATKSISQITELFLRPPLLYHYETGLLTKNEFYKAVCGATGFRGSLDEFAAFFSDIFAPMLPMIQLQAAIRARGLPTYIFSNTNELAVAHLYKSYPFFSNFDGYIFSYEHGAMKPDARLYEVVEKRTGRAGAAILYLDDRPENIATGIARHWQVILHQSPELSRQALAARGLFEDSSVADPTGLVSRTRSHILGA
jgi:HAD superfamily hydrolase (TIGR01509 family)